VRASAESDFEPRWKVKQLLVILLTNLLPLLLVLYGLKCIATLQGQLTEPGRYVMGSFFLAPVKGAAAVMTGLGDISLGIFGYLSGGSSPGENRSWLWRIVRGIIRWGSLGATFFLWHRAHRLRLGLP